MNKWIEGARPKTLAAGVVPVLVGTGVVAKIDTCPHLLELNGCHHIFAWRFVAALVVSLAIQVGVNYANDYFDGRRGVDTAVRVGPRRLTASGDATHTQMKAAIFTSFLIAGIAGLALALATSLWILLVGVAAFLAALAYSGGPKPYANVGLGELFVFVFFGLVATVGSSYVQIETVTRLAFVASIPIGFLAVAILVVNNLRDISTDRDAGKITLAVRLGSRRTRVLYRLLIAASFLATIWVAVVARSAWPLLALLAMSFAVKPTMLVGTAEGAALVPALIATARLELVYGVLLALGLWVR